ncbi:unnamed protein product [Peniophora sp. CBMAI 1063]|nr:unnamed protein product [Peniophora sp. CBMAI 1063]
MTEYPLKAYHDSLRRRCAEICIYFSTFPQVQFLVKGLDSELILGRALLGTVRLQTGRMPPYCDFLWHVQNAINYGDRELWSSLPLRALRLLTGNTANEPEPRDVSGLPMWWLKHPRHITSSYRAQPFSVSAWVNSECVSFMSECLEAEDADVKGFVSDLKALVDGVGRLQASAMERARAIDVQHTNTEEAFQLVYNARQDAATFAQRQFEKAHGLPAAPAPLPVQVPQRR